MRATGERAPLQAVCEGAETVNVGLTPFQAAVAAAFLRVMRARKPELLWAIREAGKSGERLADPHERDALVDGPTGAA
jgi:hypothetical protein